MSSASAPSARPYARGRDRRDDLIAAAVTVFAREGFGAARLSTLAAEAGMTDAGLLHHFPSKAHLYLAALESRKAHGEESAITDPDVDFHGAVEAIVAYVEHAMQNPELVRFRTVVSGEALLTDNPATEHLVRERERMHPILVGKVVRAQESGRIRRDVDAEQIVLELLSLHEGFRHMAMLYPGTFDYPMAFTTAARRWLAGLTRPDQ